ncbi:hypothetical protein PENANT_c096G02590 [Penicillium antarcticum]|uniref:Uncharacterized protein n=1 Tax=Penicillium antarcticum TaxID=416450 RepID=A0A1V6PLY5_9EURO|nr:hypothetical protein PENANT_c096G02590 [Penicillium antarcticum]
MPANSCCSKIKPRSPTFSLQPQLLIIVRQAERGSEPISAAN